MESCLSRLCFQVDSNTLSKSRFFCWLVYNRGLGNWPQFQLWKTAEGFYSKNTINSVCLKKLSVSVARWVLLIRTNARETVGQVKVNPSVLCRPSLSVCCLPLALVLPEGSEAHLISAWHPVLSPVKMKLYCAHNLLGICFLL